MSMYASHDDNGRTALSASASAAELLTTVTGRRDLLDALEWVIEGRSLRVTRPTHELLTALSTLAADDANPSQAELAGWALRSYARPALRSQLDPSVELLEIDAVVPPGTYRSALEELARHTPSGTLADVTPAAIRAAHDIDPHVVETLCAVAGLSFRDLKDRAAARLPGNPRRRWSQLQAETAFAVIDAIVRGAVTALSSAATAARPVEMLFAANEQPAGWAAVEALLSQGVPYEVLLTQRVVGSAWGAHRNATTNKVQQSVTTRLSKFLEEGHVPHLLLRRNAKSRSLLKSLGLEAVDDNGADADIEGEGARAGQVAVLVGQPDRWTLAVTVSVARDGGTANKTAGKLLELPDRLSVPVAAVLVGPGWADRNETVDLVRALDGRVFSDATLPDLAAFAAEMSYPSRMMGPLGRAGAMERR
jgi:hypothetical protein